MKKLIAIVFLLTCFCWNLNLEAEQRLMPMEDKPQKPMIGSSVAGNEACRQWVEEQMAHMSLEERIGQLMVYKLTPELNKKNRQLVNKLIKTYHIGGLLFSGGYIQGQAAVINLAQSQTKIPLMITCDGEWGLGMRMKDAISYPRNRILGCIQNDSLIYEFGLESARQMRELGITVNFAPVADVDNNPNNPVINVRSFGESPYNVANKVVAYMRGLQDGGVVAVAKHFPGHGDTDVDSHKALPTLPFDRARMDSIELYPFRRAIHEGLDGIMVAHLDIPNLSERSGLPSSLSHNIVTDLLQDELKFEGLIFTDALEMKGVASAKRTTCLQALLAGNDLLLVPGALRDEFREVVQAVKKGVLSEEEINRRCRKVLTYKYALGLNKKQHIQISGLSQRINTPEAQDLLSRLNREAVTVLGNEPAVLPFDEVVEKVAVLNVGGDAQKVTPFVEQLKIYADTEVLNLQSSMNAQQQKNLIDRLAGYQRVIVCLNTRSLDDYRQSLQALSGISPLVYVSFVPAKETGLLTNALRDAGALVLAHTDDKAVQTHVAQLLYGQAISNGRLSTGMGDLYAMGAGQYIGPESETEAIPKDYNIDLQLLAKIDTIAQEGIDEKAYPGCQIVVLKKGHEVYNKAFGTRTWNGEDAGSTPGHPRSVSNTDVYDLASLTKTTATLLAVMKLYDEQKINLSDPISQYLTYLRGTDKRNITIRTLLFHESGLPSGISFYREAIDDKSYSGKLLSAKRDRHHTVQLDGKTWGNGKFKYLKGLISTVADERHTLHVAENMWLDKSFRTEAYQLKIIDAKLLSRTYRYSDISFILLQQLVEAVTGTTLDVYLDKEFYAPMGLTRTLYLPLRRVAKEDIVPTSKDDFLRKQLLQGYVHDESAAFQGGISGNAGLFSNAWEVAQVYQMLLNGGEYKGKRYFSKSTVEVFTKTVSSKSHRGLGFDRPNVNNLDKSNCGEKAPAAVFGHTGFTGTCAWADPENDLVYVFLSNRVYPDKWNSKLSALNIRTRIQDAIYEAIGE